MQLAPTDTGDIARLVRRRFELARVEGSTTVAEVSDAALELLASDAGGSLRRAERVLYEACQQVAELSSTGETRPIILLDERQVRSAIQAVS